MMDPPALTLADNALPFTVRLVANKEDLYKAVRIRHATYERLVPALAKKLKYPEAADTETGVVLLLAESKQDGAPLGSMRLQSNEFRALHLEQSVALPGWLTALRLIEASRFGVTDQADANLVEAALFKACYQYCKKIGVLWMLIAGRAPVDQQYEKLLFQDIFPDLGFVPLLHAGNLPHRIMYFNVARAQQLWAAAGHPLYDFHFRTTHRDIDITGPVHFDSTPIKRTAYPPRTPGDSKF